MSGTNDNLMSIMSDAMNLSQNKYGKDNADNYILRCKNAEVLWYQPMKLIACIRFCEDKNKNEYHLFNYSHCFLSPGDNVKVYYTTNAAKGWIEDRCGYPNFMNEFGQRIDVIRDCCDDEDDITEETCCDTTCCSEAATRQNDSTTEVVEEWDERIEGTEDEIREYEEKEGKNSPFYNFTGNNGSE